MCCAMRKLTELFVNTLSCVYSKYPTHHFLPHPHTNTYELSQVSVFGDVVSQLLKLVTSPCSCSHTEMLNGASFLHQFTSV